MSSEVYEYPLYFVPHGKHYDLNYMRNIRADTWDISTIEEPIYLYQENVEPTAEGGKVKVEERKPNPRQKRQLYINVVQSRIPNPDLEPWTLSGRDGSTYKGEPDDLTNEYCTIKEEGDHFEMALVNQSLRMRLINKFLTTDLDEALAAEKRANTHKTTIINKYNPTYKEFVEKQKKVRKEEAIAEIMEENTIALINREANGNDDDGGGNEEFDDVGADVSDDMSNDDLAVVDGDELDLEIFDEDEWIQLMDAEEEDEEEDEEGEGKKKKGKKGGDLVTPEIPAAEAPPPPVINNDEIVREVFGAPVVREEELVRYFLDVGMATLPQLTKRFKQFYTTQEQKEELKRLVKKKCKMEKKPSGKPDGKIEMYFKLK